MKILTNVSLAECTSFGTGGVSDVFADAESAEDVLEILKTQPKPVWILGRGANTLISDKGLQGTTLHMSLKNISFEDELVHVESGMGWDDFVQACITKGLWGVELASGIPGTVGAAVVGNIAAYGQAVSDTLVSIDVIDHEKKSPAIETIPAEELDLAYRSSRFTKNSYNNLIILKATFRLSRSVTTPLKYESALVVARELGLDDSRLESRREIIMEARRRAGSLLDPAHAQKTAGSFFKNPMVSPEKADHIMNFEEHGVSKDALKKQNIIHGGDAQRVSAALVILAAGFKRGQAWGPVRLHPEHVLKIENTGGATSQQIYDVAQEIMETIKEKLDITLQPEVRFMGDFS